MKLFKLLTLVNLPDLIAHECGSQAIYGLKRERGGVIRDPRPGHSETRPSFSVYLHAGCWRWKRHDGSDGQKGSAYDFLLSLGYSETQAREELERLAGVASSGWQFPHGRQGTPAPAPDPLELARATLAPCRAFDEQEQGKAERLLSKLILHSAAGLDLQRRGLSGWEGLKAGVLRRDFTTPDGRTLAHRGALGLLITGPDGNTWALKLRNFDDTLSRYLYRIGGHGAPAWCSPAYGQGSALLIIEGELNGAAAARGLSAAGLALDVQGLAGAGGVPHLQGIAGRVVYLYADPDPAGAACVERVGMIAQAAGAAAVRMLAPLEAGDFCEELGRLGAAEFGRQLQDRLNGAELWQSANCGKRGLPQIKPAPSEGKTELWQCGTTSQGWTASDGGWGSSRGGW
ncbi:hypothetical protein [Deinococcus ruber]|uniref:Toprim domain-containing protein n=1 Tax=Deinococcus ruber TaxID=1848197 RepID=A0A918CH29_9DEIO|nr:hypothetical protein [Deinococcus ruber]GGR22543.1 hypothetical protein GCM10008957_38220 [Deinococcus ruber]